MRYLCLGYYAPERFDALSEAERQALAERCRPHDEAFNATGKVVTVATLDHGAGAHIRPTRSGPSVTDGPFAEAKEVVGSYFLLEADDLDEAVRIASLHPAARIGEELGFSMEVRPIERVWVEDGVFGGPEA
ncbi:MAG TPA: YciI family protein [Thermoanaerobaculia bacterium]|nr:YciI family protein [Thermoanaerobaculia bacterium]